METGLSLLELGECQITLVEKQSEESGQEEKPGQACQAPLYIHHGEATINNQVKHWALSARTAFYGMRVPNELPDFIDWRQKQYWEDNIYIMQRHFVILLVFLAFTCQLSFNSTDINRYNDTTRKEFKQQLYFLQIFTQYMYVSRSVIYLILSVTLYSDQDSLCRVWEEH